ncbi:SDR family oxidoreductase [Bacillus daqingensis]|uniref:SDR family oxidoreductase n=1 Tax=Bacillus daqingensis TaxID=872396 RepID=A0ABV9NPP0_9BACI
MTNYLVTGAAGFVGSNLCESLLKKGNNVRILDDLSNGRVENINYLVSNYDVEFLNGDIRNESICIEAVKDMDFVLHQAAWGSVPRSIKMPLIYDEVNIHGTLNMLEAAKNERVKKFVYASSSSVYGDEKTLPKVEGVEGKPLSPYAITKSVNELYAKNYFDLYGLETVGLRYFNVFGRRQDPDSTYAAVIPVFVKALLEGKGPTINGDGSQTRDFTYIDNVIEANLLACEAGIEASGEAFNIAYGSNITLNKLYENIKTLLNSDIDPIYGPAREGDIPHSLADISKAKELLGYNPKIDVFEGLERTMAWYVENLSGKKI